MASEKLNQASANLKENLSQISLLHTNLSEDVIPLFKLNQLRYMLSNALTEVENISKTYAQFDSPFKLFNATWTSLHNMSNSSLNNYANDLSLSNAVKNLSSDEILFNNNNTKKLDSITNITSSLAKEISKNCTQTLPTLELKDTENITSDAQFVKPVFETTTKECQLDYVKSKKSSVDCSSTKPIPTSSKFQDSTNELPNQNHDGPKLNETEHPKKVNTISNKNRISAKEFLAKRAKLNFVASEKPSLTPSRSSTPTPTSKQGRNARFTSKPSYLNPEKHFSVIKNHSHFKVLKKPMYSVYPNFQGSQRTMVQYCKMCGHFTRIISQFQGKTYDVCRNCNFTNYFF